jgi:hypothetical protein
MQWISERMRDMTNIDALGEARFDTSDAQFTTSVEKVVTRVAMSVARNREQDVE